MSNDTPVAPWYRQPWLWFLLFFPAAAIIWCIFMITMAITSENAMVTDEYSKEGKSINLELARDTKAVELGLGAVLDFSGEQEIRVTMSSDKSAVSYPYLILKLFHPTLEEKDRTIQLNPVSEHAYTTAMPRDINGRWYLDLRSPDNDWRLKGEILLPAAMPMALGTAASEDG